VTVIRWLTAQKDKTVKVIPLYQTTVVRDEISAKVNRLNW